MSRGYSPPVDKREEGERARITRIVLMFGVHKGTRKIGAGVLAAGCLPGGVILDFRPSIDLSGSTPYQATIDCPSPPARVYERE